MAKAKADIRSLARAHTDTAIKVLAGVMTQPKAPAAAKVAAASALLDRGWGKPDQSIEQTLKTITPQDHKPDLSNLRRSAADSASHASLDATDTVQDVPTTH